MKKWIDSIRIQLARLVLPEGMHVQRNGGGPRKEKPLDPVERVHEEVENDLQGS
jgi:hypothetical protein